MAQLSLRHARFCEEYVIDLNATQAAIRAGYSPKTARSTASRLLQRPEIEAYIASLSKKMTDKAGITAQDIINDLVSVVRADPNELTALAISACRYCHGIEHRHQWRTKQEFSEAQQTWAKQSARKRGSTPEPSDAGGYGYSRKLQPHPSCPACDGEGDYRVRLGDTRHLSHDAARLFRGVKQTQHGIEILMADKDTALDRLARHLGLYKEDNEQKGAGDLAAALAEIAARGSAAPIAQASRQDT